MYGIVNLAIEELVKEKFGDEIWAKVKTHGGVNIESFLSNKTYDDSITYKLASSVAEVTQLPLKEVLMAFGEYWVLKTGSEKYGSLMKAGGNNLKEFLVNLPNFHSRVMLIYKDITPPEFVVNEIAATKVELHYYSTREGLTDFMHGLLKGLAIMYKVEATITLTESRANNNIDHDKFIVSW